MLTDIFADRYKDQPIWTKFGESERRLLTQIYNLIKEVYPYWRDGKENTINVAMYKELHDQLANELGRKELAPRYYSYTQKNAFGTDMPVSGWYSYEHVFEQFLTGPFNDSWDPDAYIKARISLIELVMRKRGTEVAAINYLLTTEIRDASINAARARGRGLHVPGDPAEGVIARNKAVNDVFNAKVEELNERFRRAGAPLSFHNGFIQFATDQLVERQVSKPFWTLVAEPKWSNVDIDMKEALDQRDSNGKDPAIYAAKALESTIKIVSAEKGWTRGTERGAAQYIDNLMKKDHGFLELWEGEMLKDYFIKVRNAVGHGPGDQPMPTLTLPQTDWAIETAMSWIRTMVRRLQSS
ncbi:AbiJ-NTD4 domain-containing protein [Roseateles sp.]|uniref:AbiJ-NTD4 domain-containing protein n=1 Tax=Roseateles sp. TaxID=1971397 RepID=UPI0039E9B38A